MYYLLLSFSFVTLGVGFFAVAFGFPIRETMFGSALLISGTVAVVGGFLLVGLAAAVQELRRVVQVLRRIPGGLRPLRPVERNEVERKEGERRPPPPPQPQRAMFPNRPALDAPIPPPISLDEPPYGVDSDIHGDTRPRADFGRGDFARPDFARPDFTRADPARADDAGADTASRAGVAARADQQGPARKAAGPARLRRAIGEIESIPRPAELPAPVAPLEPRRYEEPQPVRRALPTEALPGRPGPNAGERAPMEDAWLRPRGPAAPAGAPAPAAAPESLEDYAPVPARPPHKAIAPLPNIFDMVWTNDRRRPAGESAPPPEPRSEAPALPPIRPLDPTPAPVAQSPPASEPPQRPEAHPEPRPEARPEPRPDPRPEPRAEPRPEPRPLSILKSGVIDEMAYTLFTDGSIEAQMPDGTMRFSSIEELRRHLDQHEG